QNAPPPVLLGGILPAQCASVSRPHARIVVVSRRVSILQRGCHVRAHHRARYFQPEASRLEPERHAPQLRRLLTGALPLVRSHTRPSRPDPLRHGFGPSDGSVRDRWTGAPRDGSIRLLAPALRPPARP